MTRCYLDLQPSLGKKGRRHPADVNFNVALGEEGAAICNSGATCNTQKGSRSIRPEGNSFHTVAAGPLKSTMRGRFLDDDEFVTLSQCFFRILL